MTPAPITAVLGLDQAHRTGWGIGALVDGLPPVLVRHGVAKTHAERRAVVELALSYAGGDPRQLLVMFEQHDHMALDRLTAKDHRTKRSGQHFVQRGPKQIHGMGKAYGRWEELLDMLEHPERLRDEVQPRVWRQRVLGTSRGTSDQLKLDAQTWASAMVGVLIDDPDQAEGIGITAFAMRDGVARLEQRRIATRIQARGKREEKRQLELITPAPKESA